GDFDPTVEEPIEEPLVQDEDVDGEPIPEEAAPSPEELDQEPPTEIDEESIVITENWSGISDQEALDLEDLLAELDAQDEYAEDEARSDLTEILEALNQSEAAADEREAKADDEGRKAKAGQSREEGRQAARTKAKGTVQRVVANGGRGAQDYIIRRDRSAIGYVRVSR